MNSNENVIENWSPGKLSKIGAGIAVAVGTAGAYLAGALGTAYLIHRVPELME